MPFVSVTRARARLWGYRPLFLAQVFRIAFQARAAEGNLAVKFLHDRRGAYWTCTTWDSQLAMRAFMTTGPHGRVMRKLLVWCDEAAFVHWTQPEPDLPSWQEAHRRLQQEGRTSKVNQPSQAQLQRVIAAPAVRRFGELRIK